MDDDYSGILSSEVGKSLAEKTLKEMGLDKNGKPFPLFANKTPNQDSRNWQDPNGFQYLGVWQNAALLQILVRKFTGTLPLFPTLNQPSPALRGQPLTSTLNPCPLKSEHRLIAQMDDCARSVIRNIEEGFKRPTTKEYLEFLGFSQGSLEELKGDIRDCKTYGYLFSQPFSSLKNTLNIDLRVIKGPCKGKGEIYGDPTNPNHPYYQPLVTLNPKTLTYEIFIELINKTDYLLRQLVVSLENKLNNDKKYYQVEQVRLNRRTRGED